MLHVVNTRPADRAAALTSALLQAGYLVTELPLLQLDALPLDQALSDQLRLVQQMHCVIVVSPTAAEIGLSYLQQLQLQPRQLPLQWIAVGQGTASVLQQAGLQPLTPALETSEGVLALQGVIEPHMQQQVMVWRGIGGRELMLRSLDEQGHVVHNVVLYQRGLPVQAAMQYRQLMAQQPDVLLISSGESWRHWQQLGQEMPWRLDQPASAASASLRYMLVLGERVCGIVRADLARQGSNAQVIQLQHLRPDSILSVLAAL